MQVNIGDGLIAAFVAGAWIIFFRTIPQLWPALTQKESTFNTWFQALTSGLYRAMSKSQVFTAFVIGLCFGKPLEGLAVGAVIELMFLGVFVAGAAIPPQPHLATIMATIFVIKAGATTEEALILVMPVAVLSSMLLMLTLTLGQVPLAILKKKAADADIKGFEFHMTIWQVLGFQTVAEFLPAFLGVAIGIPALQLGVDWISTHAAWAMEGMGFLAGVLPALGFALLFYQMGTKNIGFLILGVAAGIYLKPDSLTLALIGLALALIYIKVTSLIGSKTDASKAATQAAPEKSQEVQLDPSKRLDRKDLLGIYWRTFNNANVASWETWAGTGFTQSMIPVIRKLYKTKEEQSAALTRHLTYFNTNPWIGSCINGISASMEEKRANGEPIDDASIGSVKVALMGPLAGIGDSLFWATYIPIILAIGASWALSGNATLMWMAPIFVGAILTFSEMFFHYQSFFQGYKFGIKALESMKSNWLNKVTEGASIVGNFVIGGLIIKLVSLQIRWAPSIGGTAPIQIQTILNSIMPSLLPLSIFGFCYLMLRKGKTALWIMVVLMVILLLGAIPIPLDLFNHVSILGAPIVAQ